MKKTIATFILAISPLAAQQPRIVNAAVEQRSAAAGLDQVFRSLTTRSTPAWIGYAVPAVAGEHNNCCWDSGSCCRGCALEGGRNQTQSRQPVALESAGSVTILYRVQQGNVEKIRMFSADCELDAGGLPFFWLTGVNPAQSIALLESFIAGHDRADQAIAAIAMHGGAEADRSLEKLAAPGQPDRVREKVTFWLGSARGHRGYEILRNVLAHDPSEHVRDKAVFGLSVSKDPEAVSAMIEAAKRDSSSHVRGQALFWLAQKAGKREEAAITDAIENDPDTDVKKKAVFALSQLPPDEGVPLLIQVARNNRNPAARKQAMFWLGQSRDARALRFFEDVLLK